ncbi:MAG: hypothetical protein RL385_4486 [Pseudomonadota bacterium]|jgi:hypothetical protein
MRIRLPFALPRALGLLALSQGCRCSTAVTEVDHQSFIRCAMLDPPAARAVRIGAQELKVNGRRAEVSGPLPARVAVFTGPVGASLTHVDIAEVAALNPTQVWVLGGIGDDLATTSSTLAALAELSVPVLLVPGGADRPALVDAALAGLPSPAAQRIVHGAGLAGLEVGRQHFLLVPGAPNGRYAIDAEACGFVAEDIDVLIEGAKAHDRRPWVISWGAPGGLGIAETREAGDLGSPEIARLMTSVRARGGIFAWPEVASAASRGPSNHELLAWVPRLGRTGTLTADGGRLGSGLLLLRITDAGVERITVTTP